MRLPGGNELLLTRRHFLYGLAGVAAVAAVGAGGYAYSQAKAADPGSLSTLDVPESAVFSNEDCTLLDSAEGKLTLISSQELAYGSLVWASDDDVAACLLPTETGKPLAQAGVLSLATGTCTVVLEHAQGEDDGFEIYDVRANSNGMVWAEAEVLSGTWRVYHASLNSAGVLGSPVLAQEGGGDWEMPTLAVAGGYAFWQTLPKADTDALEEGTALMRARFGASEAESVYRSKSRSACAPYSDGSAVVIAPRAETDGTYYQLTRIDASSGQATDQIVLPTRMQPFSVAFGDTGFAFSFEAIYDYGGGIANLGTYTPTALPGEGITGDAATAAYSSASWFRYGATPTTSPAWCGKYYVMKSGTSVAFIDLEAREMFTIDVEDGAEDYGEFLASGGSRTRIVTYSNIDNLPLSGERERKCLVRVWEVV